MFGLTAEHYSINPKEEYDVFLVRQKEFQEFYQDLLGTLNSGKVPKYVVYGSFGIGKTHFLYHLKKLVSDVSEPIYLQTPPSHRRTSFTEFYGAVLSEIGRTRVMDVLGKGAAKPGKLRKLGMSEDLALVVENAIKNDKTFLLWKFLSGIRLKSSEADDLETIHTELAPDDAVAILNALGALNEEAGGKPLLLLVDEFESTSNIGGDARVVFTEAVRSLVDESSRVGVVFAVTARALAEMPGPIDYEPVRRRIGLTNYIQFKDYNENELEEFVYEAIQYRRDKKFDIKGALAGLKTNETVDSQSYPFSKEAVKEIVSSVALFAANNKIEAARPKELLELMDKGMRVALLNKKPFVSKDIIRKVSDEVVEGLSL